MSAAVLGVTDAVREISLDNSKVGFIYIIIITIIRRHHLAEHANSSLAAAIGYFSYQVLVTTR